MALIMENPDGRRMIKLSVDDIITVITSYQKTCNSKNYTYEETRTALNKNNIYLPEDFR